MESRQQDIQTLSLKKITHQSMINLKRILIVILKIIKQLLLHALVLVQVRE